MLGYVTVNRFLWGLVCLAVIVFETVTVQSASVGIPLAEWDAFSLDVDGDGEPEFEGSLSNEQNVALISRFDTSLATNQFPGLLPGQGAGGSSNQFASLADVQSDAIYSGSVMPVQPLFGDLHLGTAVTVHNANEAKPVWAGWRFGTSGAGNDPFEVIGFILDATAFFQSGGTAPIELHTHRYGQVTLGETLGGLSLASTLGAAVLPGPSDPGEAVAFGVETTFEGPWTGVLSFESQVGKNYQFHRSVDLLSSTIAESLAGTGERLSFRFDESQSPAERAFFWVKEVDSP